MKVYALLLCAAVSGGCAGTNQLETVTTELAHGANAMYDIYQLLCGSDPGMIVSKDCQKAAKYYEFAVCKFESANFYLGGPAVSKACEP